MDQLHCSECGNNAREFIEFASVHCENGNIYINGLPSTLLCYPCALKTILNELPKEDCKNES
jgi:hypothetical protein